MLTYEECEQIWNEATKENPILIDSSEGKQIMQWLALRNDMMISDISAPMIHSRVPFVSPVDGSVISSAAGLRAHEKEHKVIQVGDAYEKIIKDKKQAAKENAYEKKKEADHYFKYH